MGLKNTSRRPSTLAQGNSQDNPILVAHLVEQPLIVTPLATMPPTPLILFDSSGEIRVSYEAPVELEKDKGTSISHEVDLSPF